MNKDFLVLYTPFPIWEKYMGNNNVDICGNNYSNIEKGIKEFGYIG